MADERISFGGVTLKKSEVAGTKTEIVRDRYGKTAKKYIVNFKNGVKVAYTESPKGSTIFSQRTKPTDYAETTANYVNDLEMIGSKQFQNHVNIHGGSVNGIDVADNAYDSVTVNRAEASHSTPSSISSKSILSGGTIWKDKGDDTQIRNWGDGEYTTKGNAFKIHSIER